MMRQIENQAQLHPDMHLKPKPQRKCFTRTKRQRSDDQRLAVHSLSNGTAQTTEPKRERLSWLCERISCAHSRLSSPKMDNLTNSENTRIVMEHVESFLSKFATQSAMLLDEIRSAGTILKQTNISNFNTLSSSATCDLPSNIAIELRQAAEAAESKQFFTCCQKIKNASCILQTLMDEAKRTRRKIDSISMLNTTSLEKHLPLQKHCIYLEEALNLLYALNLGLHEIELTANALYIHGLHEDTPLRLEMDKLKNAIARLVAILSTKHFKSTLTTTATG